MAPILARSIAEPTHEPRRLAGEHLALALRDSRRRTLSCVEDLTDAQWGMPSQAGVNPVAWELSHLAWFAEFWILRGPAQVGLDGLGHAAQPPRIAGPDELYDSARLEHAQRWQVALPSRRQVVDMLAEQLEACLEALPARDEDDTDDDSDDELYFHRLALFHEDMHGEALVWMRAALGYPAPLGLVLPEQIAGAPLRVAAGAVELGWPAQRRGFAFDNELPSCTATLPAFEVDAQPVTAGQFLHFVEAGGYEDPSYWPGEAGAWRSASARPHPVRWRRQRAAASSQWQVRWFEKWLPLNPEQPVVHVNAFEAEAYCRWAGRRLPTAAEWEHVARLPTQGQFLWGRGVWEWTADAFKPRPGFVPGPYKDYSSPWFENHRELRGGAFATCPRMLQVRYRNFFMPHRTDIFAGFRTALTL